MQVDFTLIRDELKQEILKEISLLLNIPSEQIILNYLFIETVSDSLKLKELEKTALIKALSKTSGNISQTARLLGVSRKTVYSLIKKYAVTFVHINDN